RLKEVIDAKAVAAGEARRQARYFLMLALQESEDLKDKVTLMEDAGKEWLKSYDRNYKNTPEGYGVRYLLAEIHRGRAVAAKGKRSADISTARSIQAFWCLNTKRYRDCVQFGEALVRDDPRASQTANAAMYALHAYYDMIADHESILEKGTGDLKDDNGQKVD